MQIYANIQIKSAALNKINEIIKKSIDTKTPTRAVRQPALRTSHPASCGRQSPVGEAEGGSVHPSDLLLVINLLIMC